MFKSKFFLDVLHLPPKSLIYISTCSLSRFSIYYFTIIEGYSNTAVWDILVPKY